MTTPDIFLSYNREDAAVAKRYADAFAREGLSVWWDTALRSGEAYDEVTEAALRGAKAVVVLWSPRSVVSRWVRAEATIADRCKTLVPVTIEACERPIMFELTQTAELSHWTGDAGDRAWLAFLSDVRQFVRREVEAKFAPTAEAPATAAPTVQETLKPGQSGSAPSLAVLPFTNRSQLPEDEVFAEGMVEDVISALSQGVHVRVLGSSATASLSRSAISDLAAVGRQLGVRYLLEGNVRRVDADIRVTTQLLEASTGEVMWTAKFDRPLTELAALQEELVTDVAAGLDTQVNTIEMERALTKPDDLTAWQECMLMLSAFRKFDRDALSRAAEHGNRAIAIAPNYGFAHASLAGALGNAYLISPDDPAEVERIRLIAERAIALAPEDANVLGYAGFAMSCVGQLEEGARHAAHAVRKAPGSGLLHYMSGVASTYTGQVERALSSFDTAIRLMPGSPFMVWVKSWQSKALYVLGRWDESDAANDECISLYPSFGFFYVFKARLGQLLEKATDAPRQIETARRFGWETELAVLHWRRTLRSAPTFDDDIPNIRALYTAAEDTR